MKPFSTRRAKRNTTLVALLVWLFALGSGMANACLLEAPGTHRHVAAAHSSASPHTHTDHAAADHAGAVDDHDDDCDGAKDSCLKACDDGSNAPVKLQNSPHPADPCLASLVVFTWNAMTPIVSAPSRFNALQVPVVGPPFRVRYARLTL